MLEKRWHVFAIIAGIIAAFIALAVTSTLQAKQFGSSAQQGSLDDDTWATKLVTWPLKYNAVDYPPDYSPTPTDKTDRLRLQVELRLSNLIPAASGGSIDCRLHIDLSAAYENYDLFPPKPLYPLDINLNGQAFTISPTQSVVDFKTTFLLNSGNFLSYPFDSYTITIPILIGTTINGTTYLPNMYFKVDQTDTGHFSPKGGITFDNYTVTADDFSSASVTVTWRRPPFTRLYPMMIFILFWLINVCELLYLIPHLIGSSKGAFNNPGLYTSLLFALPSMRNALPGSPPIGCLADYYAFFWNVFLTVVLLLIAMWHFYQENRKEQRPSGVPSDGVLLGFWLNKNKGVDVPYVGDTGMLNVPVLIKFWKQNNAAESLF